MRDVFEANTPLRRMSCGCNSMWVDADCMQTAAARVTVAGVVAVWCKNCNYENWRIVRLRVSTGANIKDSVYAGNALVLHDVLVRPGAVASSASVDAV